MWGEGDGYTDLTLLSQTRSFFQNMGRGRGKGCRSVEHSV